MGKHTLRFCALLMLGVATQLCVAVDAHAQSARGADLFRRNCAQCHEHNVPGAPMKSLLKQATPNAVYHALTKGSMRLQARHLSDAGRRAVVAYLTGRDPVDASSSLRMCKSRRVELDPRAAVGTGWGIDAYNTRFVPTEQAGLTASEIPRLKLQWSFGFPDGATSRSQPVVAGNVLFVGSRSGIVYALDTHTACVHWTFQASGEIRGAIIFGAGESTLYFDDVFANVYAIDAASGALRWKIRVDDHPAARIAATPVLSRERIYVPLGSWGEEIAAGSPDYICCTFRGSIVALDRETGERLWKRHTIETPAVEQYRSADGHPHFGPSGAGVWSSPAYDEKRQAVYFTTGNNYSDPADDNSNAVFAIDAITGQVKWKRQTFPNDTFNDGCKAGKRLATCPKKAGPDADFTAPPILVRGARSRDVLLAGQKTGDVFALDPDTGALRWHTRVSRDPNPLSGGIWFGMAVHDGLLIVPAMSLQPLNTPLLDIPDEMLPASHVNGLHALDAFTGKRIWSAPVNRDCEKSAPCAGVQMAPLAIKGVVFAGSVDGYIRAYDADSGKVLWRFDAAGDSGGHRALVGAGAVMVANGMLYVNVARPSGGALLAFSAARMR